MVEQTTIDEVVRAVLKMSEPEMTIVIDEDEEIRVITELLSSEAILIFDRWQQEALIHYKKSCMKSQVNHTKTNKKQKENTMKNPKCPGCSKHMKILPKNEPEFKKWGGRLCGTAGIFRVLNNVKPLSPILGVVGHAALSGASFYLAGRELGKRAGQYVDSHLDNRFVCYTCNIIKGDCENKVEPMGSEALADETETGKTA